MIASILRTITSTSAMLALSQANASCILLPNIVSPPTPHWPGFVWNVSCSAYALSHQPPAANELEPWKRKRPGWPEMQPQNAARPERTERTFMAAFVWQLTTLYRSFASLNQSCLHRIAQDGPPVKTRREKTSRRI